MSIFFRRHGGARGRASLALARRQGSSGRNSKGAPVGRKTERGRTGAIRRKNEQPVRTGELGGLTAAKPSSSLMTTSAVSLRGAARVYSELLVEADRKL